MGNIGIARISKNLKVLSSKTLGKFAGKEVILLADTLKKETWGKTIEFITIPKTNEEPTRIDALWLRPLDKTAKKLLHHACIF